jgi:hypothetical protein
MRKQAFTRSCPTFTRDRHGRAAPNEDTAHLPQEAAVFTPRRTISCAAALLAITATASGCGSTHRQPAAAHSERAATSPAPTGAYINAVSRLHTTVANASSSFFHARRAHMHAETKALEHAYATAAAELHALPTPAAASVPARQLFTAWHRGAQGLSTVLAHHPFNPGRAWDSAQQSAQSSEQAFGTVLTVP